MCMIHEAHVFKEKKIADGKRFFALGAAMVVAIALLSACSGNNGAFFQKRHWDSVDIALETRPHPIRAGHNEFLLHLYGPPGHRLPEGIVVRYRLHPQDAWIEAMPDGMSDVFRRALTVRDPKHAKLYVHLRFHGKETQMVFNLSNNRVRSKP